MTAFSAMLRQKRLEKQLALSKAAEQAGISPVLFSQIEAGTENAPQKGQPSSALLSSWASTPLHTRVWRAFTTKRRQSRRQNAPRISRTSRLQNWEIKGLAEAIMTNPQFDYMVRVSTKHLSDTKDRFLEQSSQEG